MSFTGVILKPDVTGLTIALGAGIREVMQLLSYNHTKVTGFEASWNGKVLKNIKFGSPLLPPCFDHMRYRIISVLSFMTQVLNNTLALQ